MKGTKASIGFYVVLVPAMSLTFLTYFLAVPVFPVLATKFKVSQGVTNQLGTGYEVGKCVGLLLYGVITRHWCLLPMMAVGFVAYAIIAAVLGLVLQFGELHEIWPMFLIYVVLSITCIISQFGLALIKTTTNSDTPDGKRLLSYLVSAQGLVAATLQMTGPYLGSLLNGISIASPFYMMTIAGVGFGSLLWIFGPAKTVDDTVRGSYDDKQSPDPASPAALAEPAPTAPVDPPDSYWVQVWQLATGRRHRGFRVYTFFLGIATTGLYVFPLMANNALTNAGVSSRSSTFVVLLAFIPNLALRALPMIWTAVSRDALLAAGMILQFAGCVILLACALFMPLPSNATDMGIGSSAGLLSLGPAAVPVLGIAVPGGLLMAGVGAMMPNCKSGAMLGVDDDLSTTAASVLKLAQLLFVAIVQALVGACAVDPLTAVRNQSILLSAVCLLGLCSLGLLDGTNTSCTSTSTTSSDRTTGRDANVGEHYGLGDELSRMEAGGLCSGRG